MRKVKVIPRSLVAGRFIKQFGLKVSSNFIDHGVDGKVFYFQPGHEGNPTYYIPQVQQILINAVRWAAPQEIIDEIVCPHAEISPEQARRDRGE